MKHQTVNGRSSGLSVIARAEFTLEMLRNLVVVFEAAAEDNSVTVEMCDRAVWAVTPDGCRMFIGRAHQPPPLDA